MTAFSTPNSPDTPVIDTIIGFLDRIGIHSMRATLPEGTFLPGVAVEGGILQFDEQRLRWPGDLLHEAGHIATMPPSRRAGLSGKLEVTPADEMAALAWSYAAALACGIDPHTVFHEGGYKHGGAELVCNYASGLPPGGPGVPMLQWYGMTQSFPSMDHWLRQKEDPT